MVLAEGLIEEREPEIIKNLKKFLDNFYKINFMKIEKVLLNATKEQRDNFEIGHFGIYWPDLNEDMGMNGFFEYKREVTLH